MNKIQKFINSLYLGDRFCEDIIFQENKIIIQMNCISRLKEGFSSWNYYTEKDIQHGQIIFDEVVSYQINSDLLINDEIYEISSEECKDGTFLFIVYGCNVSSDATSTDIELKIKAKKIYILDPNSKNVIYE